MTQFFCGRPLREANLSDEFRFHPMHAASRQPVADKRASRPLQLRQLSGQALERGTVVPRSDLARIHKLSPTVKTHQ